MPHANEGRDPETGRFQTGNNGGPGRQKGSRNKLGQEFIDALYADFQEHGEATIQKVRSEKPDAYIKVIAQLLPAQIDVSVYRDLSDEELDRRIRQLAAALNLGFGTGGNAGGKEATERGDEARSTVPGYGTA